MPLTLDSKQLVPLKYPLLILASVALVVSATSQINIAPDIEWKHGLISVLPFWFWIGIALYLYVFIDFLGKVKDDPRNKKVLLTVIALMFMFGALINFPSLYLSPRMWVPDAYIWMASSLTIIGTGHTNLVTYAHTYYTPAFILSAAIHHISGLSMYQVYYYINFFLGYVFALIWFLFLLTITNSIRISALAAGLTLVGGGHWSPATLGWWLLVFTLFAYFKGLKNNDRRFLIVAYISSIALVFTHHLSALLLLSILLGFYLAARAVEILPEKYFPELKELKPDLKFILIVGIMFGLYMAYSGLLEVLLSYKLFSTTTFLLLLAGGAAMFLILKVEAVNLIFKSYVSKASYFLKKSSAKKSLIILSSVALIAIFINVFTPLSEQQKKLADVISGYTPLTIEGLPAVYLSSYLYGYLVLFLMGIAGIWLGVKKKYKFVLGIMGLGAVLYAQFILSTAVLQSAFLEPLRVLRTGKMPMQILSGISYSYLLFEHKKITKLLVVIILMSLFLSTFTVGNYRIQGFLYYDSVHSANMWTISHTYEKDRIAMPPDVIAWMRYEYLIEYQDNDPIRANLVRPRQNEIIYTSDKVQSLKSIYEDEIEYVYIYYQNIRMRMQTMYAFRDKPPEYKRQVLRKFDVMSLDKIYSNGATIDVFSGVK